MTKRKNEKKIVISKTDFRFEKWLTGSISLESYEAKGVFMDLIALYGHKGRLVTINEVVNRFNNHPAIERLKGRLFKVDEQGFIRIKYVDEQINEKTQKRIILSKNGQKGGLKAKATKKAIKLSEKVLVATPVPQQSITPTVTPTPPPPQPPKPPKPILTVEKRKNDFGKTLIPFTETYGNKMIREFYDYWTEPLQAGGGNRFRKEAETAWKLERRLKTWFNNQKNIAGSVKNGEPIKPVYTPKPRAKQGESLQQIEERVAKELEISQTKLKLPQNPENIE